MAQKQPMPGIHEWESAEKARSDHEAFHTAVHRFRADEQEVARYLQPARDSVFPLEYVFALLGDIRGRTVLDCGCGTGENSLLLARRGARVIGVDISSSLIALACRRFEMNGLSDAAEFVVGSSHDLPLATGSVDIVVGVAVLHHLNLERAAHEIFRVLKNGGRAIFKEPVRDSRMLRAVRKLIPYRAPDVSPFERPLTSSELRQFCARFRTDSIRAFSLPFVNLAEVVAPLRKHISTVYRLDGAVLRALPRLGRFCGTTVVELSKRELASDTACADTVASTQVQKPSQKLPASGSTASADRPTLGDQGG